MNNLVIFLYLFACVNCICDFNSGIPLPGECEGPMARALAKRAAVSELNYNCPIDKVFTYHDEIISCNECIPGSHGDQRFLGTEYNELKDNEYCIDTHGNIPKCYTTEFTPTSMFDTNCGLNEYCTEEGFCESKTSLSEESCEDGKCKNGLQCINNICKICENDVNLSYEGQLVGKNILEPGTCHMGVFWHQQAPSFTESSRDKLLVTIIVLIAIGIVYHTRFWSKIISILKERFQKKDDD